MCKKVWTVAKLNLKTIRNPYFVTALVVLAMLAQALIKVIIATNRGYPLTEMTPGVNAYFWLLPLLAAIHIPSKNFRRISNLGGKRNDFFWGSLTTHAILAFSVSLVNMFVFYSFDNKVEKHYMGLFSPVGIFGWIENGAAVAFIQQFAFLFLVMAFFHTFTAIQDKWYGWATDIVIAAILSVFIPIPILRSKLVWFFNLIIFHSNAALQISACMILALAIYTLNKPIFARKAI
jgi:hypothetical protein